MYDLWMLCWPVIVPLAIVGISGLFGIAGVRW